MKYIKCFSGILKAHCYVAFFVQLKFEVIVTFLVSACLLERRKNTTQKFRTLEVCDLITQTLKYKTLYVPSNYKHNRQQRKHYEKYLNLFCQF